MTILDPKTSVFHLRATNFWFIIVRVRGVNPALPNGPVSLSSFPILLLLHIFQVDPICSCSLFALLAEIKVNNKVELNRSFWEFVTTYLFAG